MNNQETPTLDEIILMYKDIYPPETIRTVHSYLRGRIDSLTPLVEINEIAPLITQAERENWEVGEGRIEVEKKSQNNKSTKKALEDCKIAWERLITGRGHLCRVCDSKIDRDRKQARPEATTCINCRLQKPIHVH